MRVARRWTVVAGFLGAALFWTSTAYALTPTRVAENTMLAKLQAARDAAAVARFTDDPPLDLVARAQSKYVATNGYTHSPAHWNDNLDANVNNADPDVGSSDYCWSFAYIHDPHHLLTAKQAARRAYKLIKVGNPCITDASYNVSGIGVFRSRANWYFTVLYATDPV